MKTLIAVIGTCLAAQSWAQITVGSTNTVTPGLTNQVVTPVSSGIGVAVSGGADPAETVWLDDATPAGALLSSAGSAPDEAWDWAATFWDGQQLVRPYSGSLLHISPLAAGWHRHYFSLRGLNLGVNPGDSLIAYLYLPATNTPQSVMLQWLSSETNWNHCAVWGVPTIATNGLGMFYAGGLPPAGQWVRLAVPAEAVGLGLDRLAGISFSLYEGTAAWDRAGKLVQDPAALSLLTGRGQPGSPGSSSLTNSTTVGGGQADGGGVQPLDLNCAPPPGGLAAWWRGETNCLDFLGQSPGTAQGNLTYIAGEVNNGFSLDGLYADVRVPSTGSINVGSGSGFTVEAWVNPTDFTCRPIVEWNNPNLYPCYGAHFWASQPLIYGSGPGCLYANLIDVNGNSHYFTSPAGLLATNNTWQHVALTFSASSYQACMYYNGVLVASNTWSAFTPQTAWDLYLGARPAGPGAARWQGGLDEVTVYSQALGAADISAIYKASTLGKCTNSAACTTAPMGLVSWWRAQNDCTDAQGCNPGTGVAVSYSNGEVQQAFYLNGSAYVYVPASSSLNVGSGSFTVETWINPADFGKRPIVEWNSNSGGTPWGTHLWASQPLPYGSGPGCIYANVFDVNFNSHWFNSSPYVLGTNVWQHVALVYNQSNSMAYIYYNGTQVASTNLNGAVPQTAYGFYLGSRVLGDGATNWLGGIDEASLYRVALSQTQIAAIYSEGSGGKCPGSGGTAPYNINLQPPSPAVCPGNGVTFTVTSDGTRPLSYQWKHNGTAISGANASSYIIPSAGAGDAGSYTVNVSNTYGNADSSAGTLTVVTPPTITANPQPITVCQGNNASFSVTATGTSPFSYQWTCYGTNLPNANSSTYSITGVQPAAAGPYAVTVWNSCGTASSATANLTVTVPIVIGLQPASQSVLVGANVTFSVGVTSAAPFSYQWTLNGVAIQGATNSILTLTNVQTTAAGNYAVSISDACGSVTSSNAALSVGSSLAVWVTQPKGNSDLP